MALPTKEEISLAIERPEAIKTSELEGYVPMSGIIGPESYSGGFCIVFPFVKGLDKKAVRIWHQEIDNIQERYKLLTKDTKHCRIKSLISIEYIESGLTVGASDIDLTLMEWIEGKPLKAYLSSIIKSDKSESTKREDIKALANELKSVFKEMHAAGFSHGDLQHENIIVTDKGELRLIDYDCFYTPSMGTSFIQTTSGYKGYQHPSRFIKQYVSNGKTDYFSELILFLSIWAIANDFSLLDISEGLDYALIFTPEDFIDLRNSSTYKRIRAERDDTCNILLDILADYLKKDDINQLEPFDVIMERMTKAPLKSVGRKTNSTASASRTGCVKNAESTRLNEGKKDKEKKAKEEAEKECLKELGAWMIASRNNTSTGYQIYLKSYPFGEHVQEARERIAECAEEAEKERLRERDSWIIASRNNTSTGYQVYLNMYPLGEHVQEAVKRMAECIKAEEEAKRLAAIKAEEEAWVNACRLNSANAFSSFLSKYPNSKYKEMATRRLKACKEAKGWEQAKASNAITKLEGFIKNYPDSIHVAEAKTIISNIRAQLKEDNAWKTAQNIGTIESYKSYLSQYPNGQYMFVAKNNIERLKKSKFPRIAVALIVLFIVIAACIVLVYDLATVDFDLTPSQIERRGPVQPKPTGVFEDISQIENELDVKLKGLELQKKRGKLLDVSELNKAKSLLGRLSGKSLMYDSFKQRIENL